MIGELDLRDILPAIHVPTLVLHRTADRLSDVNAGRYLAEKIPGATFVELPGDEGAFFVGNQEAVLSETERFLTGSVRSRPPAGRVLYTVLFTDIVGSTEQAVRLGDRRWRELLDSYYRGVRRALENHRGREVKTTGDGFLAVFDGPARAVACAHEIVEAGRRQGIETRAGAHTGECEVMGGDIAGLAVHIGARVAAKASAGEVLVSSTVRDLVAGSGLRFVERGVHTLKGVPEEWKLFASVDPRPSYVPRSLR
jgi:class 3 adenylate cyclase